MGKATDEKQSAVEETAAKELTVVNSYTEGIPLLENLFEEKETWDSQDKIILALEDKGYKVSQTNVSRWLKRLGAKQNAEGEWVLGEDYAFMMKLRGLKENIVDSGVFSYSLSSARLQTAVITTKRLQNHMIADQMKQIFEDEIICTFCPDEENIIVFYCRGKDDSGKVRKKSRFSLEIQEILRTMKKRQGE